MLDNFPELTADEARSESEKNAQKIENIVAQLKENCNYELRQQIANGKQHAFVQFNARASSSSYDTAQAVKVVCKLLEAKRFTAYDHCGTGIVINWEKKKEG